MTKKTKGRLVFIWYIIVFVFIDRLENILKVELVLWKYMIIAVPLMFIGNFAIDKLIKVK
ncbi:MAG: hypothetical protein ACOWWH_00800 [Eubacteriaceae bacterium]